MTICNQLRTNQSRVLPHYPIHILFRKDCSSSPFYDAKQLVAILFAPELFFKLKDLETQLTLALHRTCNFYNLSIMKPKYKDTEEYRRKFPNSCIFNLYFPLNFNYLISHLVLFILSRKTEFSVSWKKAVQSIITSTKKGPLADQNYPTATHLLTRATASSSITLHNKKKKVQLIKGPASSICLGFIHLRTI